MAVILAALASILFTIPLTADEATQTPTTTPSYSRERVLQAVVDAKRGDAQRGVLVFASARFGCISCHQIGEHGGRTGPELSEIGRKRTPEQIVESLFWPRRIVEKDYIPHVIATVDGRTLQGYLQEETDSHISLRDPPTGKVTTIAIDDIDERKVGDSLMPEGLTAAMSQTEKQDLICFLSSLGRDGGITAISVAGLLKTATTHGHGPAKFPYDREPLQPDRWPHRHEPINTLRLYDFYAKQADYFHQQPMVPPLLMEFPGVEGEGGDSEVRRAAVEKDNRWNQTQVNPVLSGVFRAGELTISRGVCVRIGDRGEMGVCFNPETLSYEALWEGEFLKFSSIRHGFMEGLAPAGKLLPAPEKETLTQPFVYHGFYRHGNRVLFSYRIGDQEYLDSPWVDAGRFQRIVAPAGQHPLRHLTSGGPSFWPQELVRDVELGKGDAYAVDTLQLPVDNPWNDLLFCGGVAFLPDGSALVTTMQGDVWRATGFDYPSKKVHWRKVASGIHQAQGIVANQQGVFVLGRDQITRLHDLNHDGEYDFHECFCNGYVTSTFGHDFVCGLECDAQGNFYTSSSKQGLLKISPDGKTVTVLATGFRNPDGLGLMDDGTLTVPCSQGNWTPASMICAVRPAVLTQSSKAVPPFYGYGGPQNGKPPELPLVYLPRGLDNSSGGQTVVRGEKWGPLEGQLLHFSYGASCYYMILKDEVDGHLQGAIVPMPGDFRSGIHRGMFRPQDGQLYVAGQSGWGAFTVDDGCFERVRYTGAPVRLPIGFHVHQNGVRIDFSEPLPAEYAGESKNHFAQCWNYRYSGAYGSPEYSPSHPGTPGHDPLAIQSAHLLENGRSLFLEIPDIQPVNQLHLRLRVGEQDRQDLFLTVHKLDEPWTNFPGYQAIAKTIQPHPLIADLAFESKRISNPYQKSIPGARAIQLRTAGNLQYEQKTLTAKPGEVIAFTLVNADVVPHNWALLKPGTLQSVGQLANQLVADPDAYPRQYIPVTDDVLAYVDIVSPGKKDRIFFRVPNTPGRYPYVCTFPGHWTVMNGELIVSDD